MLLGVAVGRGPLIWLMSARRIILCVNRDSRRRGVGVAAVVANLAVVMIVAAAAAVVVISGDSGARGLTRNRPEKKQKVVSSPKTYIR